jgi:Zn-finger nucleic acid-binding protein
MIDNLVCPTCTTRLQQRSVGSKAGWCCSVCSGIALNLAVVRAHLDPKVAAAFWTLARTAEVSARCCPSCRRNLRQIQHSFGAESVEVDVCTGCQLVWFDHGELERFGASRAALPAQPQLKRTRASGAREASVEAAITGFDAVGAIFDVACDFLGSWD